MNAFISSGLLAASVLLGQNGEPPISGKGPILLTPPTIQQAQVQQPAPPYIQPPQGQQPSRPIFGWFSREDRPLMSKIQGWWKKEPEPKKDGPLLTPGKDTVIRETPALPVSKPMPTPAPTPSYDFPRKLPNSQSKSSSPRETIVKETPTNIQQTTLQQTALPRSGTSPILAQFANKIGRDQKFEWITGQLDIDNNNYVLHYATPETVDKFHGRIVLLPQQIDLKEFRKGDLVSVIGQLSQRQTLQGIVPIYRVTHASLVERPKN